MSALIFNHTPHSPLGERLRQARLDRGATIKKASKDLNIAGKYLEAIERNQPGLLPSPDYFDKFLSAYGKYLNIPAEEISELKKRSEKIIKVKTAKKQNLVAWSEYLGHGLVLIIIIGLVVFLLWKVETIFQPPLLNIISPRDGLVTYDRQLEVVGLSTPEAEIVINNQAVFVDAAGKFTTTADLQNGLNLIKITAKKRYSRESEAQIRVLFNE